MDKAQVATFAIALSLPVVLTIPKAAGLRDSVFSKWSKRVDLAYAGLSERAVALLRRIQRETQKLLGDAGDVDPAAALSDPAALAGVAGNFQRTIRVRDGLRRRYKTLVTLAIGVPVLSGIYILGVWAVASHYLSWLKWAILPEIGYWLVGVSLALGMVLASIYFYLEWRLTTADMMSQPPSSNGSS